MFNIYGRQVINGGSETPPSWVGIYVVQQDCFIRMVRKIRAGCSMYFFSPTRSMESRQSVDDARMTEVHQSSSLDPHSCLEVPTLSAVHSQLRQHLEDECAAHIVPVIKQAVEDRSWRVRCAMARGFSEAARALGPKLTTEELLPCLTR